MLELAKYRLREMIDLRGCEDDDRNIRLRPRFGRVEPSGGAYLLRLADNPDAARITPHTAVPDDDPPETIVQEDVDHYDIDASPRCAWARRARSCSWPPRSRSPGRRTDHAGARDKSIQFYVRLRFGRSVPASLV